ncbi:50S ribosomal protein L18, partial [bacterium]|nr:50S ribosomal protein L18 [bacterium]
MRPRTRSEFVRRRHQRLRQKLRGTAARPRMAVALSGQHIYVQFIDDLQGRTLAAVSTLSPQAKGTRPNLAGAKKICALAAEQAKANKISVVLFDRGGFRYHGRIKALADAA